MSKPFGPQSGQSTPLSERPGTTLGAVLDAAARRLGEQGVPEPRRHAAALWAWLIGSNPGQVWLQRGEAPGDAALAGFDAALARRLAGEPLPYVIGSTGFRTLELKVDRRVLIPRPETEGLVDRVLAWAGGAHGAERWGTAADIGTGSGCLALSLAVEGRFVKVVGTDLSDEALTVARDNHQSVGPAVPVEFRRGDLFEPLDGEQYEVIVSNPPYVSEREYLDLEPGVREFEPRVALVSGQDGMEHLRRLVEGAAARLVAGGLLAVEVDARRAAQALEFARRQGWRDSRLEEDLFGRPRYLLAIKEHAS